MIELASRKQRMYDFVTQKHTFTQKSSLLQVQTKDMDLQSVKVEWISF